MRRANVKGYSPQKAVILHSMTALFRVALEQVLQAESLVLQRAQTSFSSRPSSTGKVRGTLIHAPSP